MHIAIGKKQMMMAFQNQQDYGCLLLPGNQIKRELTEIHVAKTAPSGSMRSLSLETPCSVFFSITIMF